MYVVIVNEDYSVKEIIKHPTEEQKKQGHIVESLKEIGQFIKKDEVLYFTIKGRDL